jgi:pyridoxal phosphate enzyme (YggS family)
MTSYVDPSRVVSAVASVRGRISAAGGDPDRVTVVAVTKGFGADAGRAAFEAGLLDLGENYADELVEKAGELAAGGLRGQRWHFLGSVQRNKVARLAHDVALWQSVDRVEEGAAIARHAPGASVLVEVEASGLPGRGGVPLEAVAPLVGKLSALGLDVRGLMTVAPPIAVDSDATARAFSSVGRLVTELGLEDASMGMSDDLELAVAAGATMVRVGRALFGPRPQVSRVSQ